MRLLLGLLSIVPHVSMVNANVEKVIFVAPSPAVFSHVHPAIDDLRLHTLSPLRTILPLQLPVSFPSQSMPHGLESWYLLRALQDGRRYEVRICWPATQPTDFWLHTYPITHIFDSPALVTSLAQYSDQLQHAQPQIESFHQDESVLFLRIQAAASYYSTNQTLMAFPSPVHVDIILDPFILNIFPQSLTPFALYVSVVSIGAWFLSGYIYRCLLSIATEPISKPHTD